jgi:hypothetical protein
VSESFARASSSAIAAPFWARPPMDGSHLVPRPASSAPAKSFPDAPAGNGKRHQPVQIDVRSFLIGGHFHSLPSPDVNSSRGLCCPRPRMLGPEHHSFVHVISFTPGRAGGETRRSGEAGAGRRLSCSKRTQAGGRCEFMMLCTCLFSVQSSLVQSSIKKEMPPTRLVLY